MPELDAACDPTVDRTIDLSADGLRAYLVCYGADGANNDLHVAVRSALDAPFVLDAATYGLVGASAAIATGELTLYTSGFQPGSDPGLVFERATTSEPFGDGVDIPGLEGINLVTPDPSPDGLWLFGASETKLAVAARATLDEPFMMLDFTVVPENLPGLVSPTISEDCRSLYAVQQSGGPLAVVVFER